MDAIIRLNCLKSISHISRVRLFLIIRSIANKDDNFVKLIKSFIELNVVDEERILSPISTNEGIPPVRFISNVLFNIILSDIDMGIEKQLPKL